MKELLFNEQIADTAIETAIFSVIRAAMGSLENPEEHTPFVERSALHIVVGLSDGTLLKERSMGDSWTEQHKQSAITEFELVYDTEASSKYQDEEEKKFTDKEGNNISIGSCIDDTIIVTCSGADKHWNEMFSKVIAALMHGFAEQKRVEAQGSG